MTIKQYFQYLNLKRSLLHRVKELTKSNQTGYGVYHGYLECKTKRIFAIACLGIKLAFHTEIFKYFDYFNFKIRFISLDWRVVQIDPNWVWSILGMEYFLSIPLIPVNFRSFRSSLASFEGNLSGIISTIPTKTNASYMQNRWNRQKPTNTDVSYAIFVGIS